MEQNKEAFEELIGTEKYKEELGLLNKLQVQEQKKGEFLAIQGNVDCRSGNLMDKAIPQGFDTACGVKGGKLSGG